MRVVLGLWVFYKKNREVLCEQKAGVLCLQRKGITLSSSGSSDNINS